MWNMRLVKGYKVWLLEEGVAEQDDLYFLGIYFVFEMRHSGVMGCVMRVKWKEISSIIWISKSGPPVLIRTRSSSSS